MVRPSPALVHRVQGVRWVRSAGRGSVGRAAPAPTCASSDTRSTAHARPLRPASIAGRVLDGTFEAPLRKKFFHESKKFGHFNFETRIKTTKRL